METPLVDTPQRSGKTNILVLFFFVLFLLLAGLIILYLWNKDHPTTPQGVAPIPTQVVSTPTMIPSPTSSPSAEMLADISVQVLNGSGTSGSAQGVASSLRTAGFTKLTVGNADAFTYEDITVQVTELSAVYLPIVREAITSSNTNAQIVTEIAEDLPVDIIVIVGE